MVDGLIRDGRVVVEQGEIRLADFTPRLSDRQQTLATELVGRISAAGVEPPTLEGRSCAEDHQFLAGTSPIQMKAA